MQDILVERAKTRVQSASALASVCSGNLKLQEMKRTDLFPQAITPAVEKVTYMYYIAVITTHL